MASIIPRDANEFIEQQLDERLRCLEQTFDSDVLTFNGPLVFGVDDLIRNEIEKMRQNTQGRRTLTLILTTFGGYIEVVHRIVDTLRHHYEYVNFVVPNQAFSAGTVLVMSGDAIYMDYYSRLGPIDPQVETGKGQVVPALGYLIQWERLLKKAQGSELTMAEMQLMIDGFNQAELYKYEQERELSIAFLKEWLVKYKFKSWVITETRKETVTPEMREGRALAIANQLNDPQKWHTHGHGISMEVLRRDLKLIIDDFGANSKMRDGIRNYHSLLADYMTKRRNMGVIHTIGTYLPFMQEES